MQSPPLLKSLDATSTTEAKTKCQASSSITVAQRFVNRDPLIRSIHDDRKWTTDGLPHHRGQPLP